jgi:hypothetical protein
MSKVFDHVMIDLETMGTRPDAAIVSIAAVEFDITTGEFGRKFYEKVELQSCLDLGMTVDGATIMWWLNQDEAARRELRNGQRNLNWVLFKLTHFLAACQEGQVWGNGISFDLAILSNAYRAVGQQRPWSHRVERDMRTMVMLNPDVKATTAFRGIKHHPVADCLHQIEVLSEIYRLTQNVSA